MMKITTESELKINRTALYLLPNLRKHGVEYKENLSIVHKKAIGIADDANELEGNNIYILLDAAVNTKTFIRVLNWVKNQPYYIADYEFDDMLDGTLHMLVLHVPDIDTYDNFIKSKYSKMYSAKDLRQFIDKDSIILGVLTRDKETLDRYVTTINKEWETAFTSTEWTEELDYPWKNAEEIFELDVQWKKRNRKSIIKSVSEDIEEDKGAVGYKPIDN